MHVFDDVLEPSVVEEYRRQIELHYATQLEAGQPPLLWYPTRNTDITDHPVVDVLRSFIEARLRLRLTCYQAELQTWPIGVESEPHIHTKGREIGDYNSLLYLNDEFTGGEFFAEPGIRVRPVRNRLTFFDGSKHYHGITKVGGCHRYTMILWWRDTQPY
ncbi:MAG: hypothetical protein KF850_04040 [Labilithrix sp.]|nr:hypothetical protein [Labilithrix sp.]MBX3211180.1 hypothetical protein [Labilithrix sp.]